MSQTITFTKFRIQLLLLLICFLGAGVAGYAQNGSVGIGTRTPDTSAILDITSQKCGAF